MQHFRVRQTAAIVAALCWLTGCIPTTEPLTGPQYYDPFRELRHLSDHSETYRTEIAQCMQALESNENDVEALYQRGILYAATGRYQDAMTDLTQVVSLIKANGEPEQLSLVTVYRKRGLIHWENKDVDSAIDDFSQALEQEPDNTDILFHRWQAYLRQGNNEKARLDRLRGKKLDQERFEEDYGFQRGVI